MASCISMSLTTFKVLHVAHPEIITEPCRSMVRTLEAVKPASVSRNKGTGVLTGVLDELDQLIEQVRSHEWRVERPLMLTENVGRRSSLKLALLTSEICFH